MGRWKDALGGRRRYARTDTLPCSTTLPLSKHPCIWFVKISEVFSLNHSLSPCHLMFVVGRRRLSRIWAAGVKKKRAARTNKGLAGHTTARRDTAEETKGYEINFGPFFSLSFTVVGCQLLSLDDSLPPVLSPLQLARFSRAS